MLFRHLNMRKSRVRICSYPGRRSCIFKDPPGEATLLSPQLDLEIVSFEEGKSQLHGVFGPKPAVWTMFMSCISRLRPYSSALASGHIRGLPWTNPTLCNCFSWVHGACLVRTIFAGRMGKAAGRDEKHLLYNFMKETLEIG